jgi:ArsR family transcriptional regulator, arsenate/arsenite/antimonite-responsive transcriptional repressor
MNIEKLAETLKVLGDPTRLQIVAMLNIRDLCVCELVPMFSISQPAISRHLSRLRSVELVKETRKGMWVHYSLNRQKLEEVGFSLSHLPDMTERLNELRVNGALPECK